MQFLKLPKVNNRQMGKNSPDLVTLDEMLIFAERTQDVDVMEKKERQRERKGKTNRQIEKK
jgi:hypothetical protein